MTNSSCNESDFSPVLLILFASSHGASGIACLIAAILLFSLRLYKVTVYRLSLYQVLAALFMSAVCSGQAILLLYPPASEAGRMICVGLSFLYVYFEWMKLLLVSWVTFHLFSFAVLYKNLRRLEKLYVASSVTFPAIIATIPLLTNSYGLSGSWCWIKEWKDTCSFELYLDGVIEQFTLWYGPAMIALSSASLAMVVMVIVLLRRAYLRCAIRKDPNLEALKQLLPLSAYPVMFVILMVPPMIKRISFSLYSKDHWLSDLVIFCGAGWSLSAGITLLVHLLATKSCSRLRSYIQVKKKRLLCRIREYDTISD